MIWQQLIFGLGVMFGAAFLAERYSRARSRNNDR